MLSALQSILLATKEAQEFLKKPYRQLLWFLPEVKKSKQTFKKFQSFMEKLVREVRLALCPSKNCVPKEDQLQNSRDYAHFARCCAEM